VRVRKLESALSEHAEDVMQYGPRGTAGTNGVLALA